MLPYKGGQSGTWTPKFEDSIADSTIRGSSYGIWYKLGRLVFINGYIHVKAYYSSANVVCINGHPFNAAAEGVGGLYSTWTAYTTSARNTPMTSAASTYIYSGYTSIYLRYGFDGRNWQPAYSDMGDSGDIIFGFCFLTNE